MKSIGISHNVLCVARRAALCLMVSGMTGCLSYSHYKYSKRAEAAQVVPEKLS